MNILIVSSFLPYPLHNGGSVRLYNLIKQIGQKHSITLICEKRPNQTEEDREEVEKICDHVVTVARSKQWSLKNILKTGFSSSPFLLVGHTSPAMKLAIKQELLQKKYDLIHIETFYVMQNLPQTLLPTVLVEHNIEYFIYERYAQKAPFFLRPLLSIDVKKLKKVEKQAWKNATVVAAVSMQDKDVIRQSNSFVVPNGVDTSLFRPKNIPKDFATKEKKILFIGDYAYVQNKDAVRYIIKSIWPILKQNVQSKVTLWIVGKNMSEHIKDLGKGDSTIFFDDTNSQTAAEIFSQADILLAPIRVGGGTSYKIIEAMAVGTPVVTTTLGHEGIEVKKDTDIIVADTPEAMVRAVVELLSDEKAYRELSSNARKAVEKVYDWKEIAKALDNVYKSVT